MKVFKEIREEIRTKSKVELTNGFREEDWLLFKKTLANNFKCLGKLSLLAAIILLLLSISPELPLKVAVLLLAGHIGVAIPFTVIISVSNASIRAFAHDGGAAKNLPQTPEQ